MLMGEVVEVAVAVEVGAVEDHQVEDHQAEDHQVEDQPREVQAPEAVSQERPEDRAVTDQSMCQQYHRCVTPRPTHRHEWGPRTGTITDSTLVTPQDTTTTDLE